MLSCMCRVHVAAGRWLHGYTMRMRARRLHVDMGGLMCAWLGGAHHG